MNRTPMFLESIGRTLQEIQSILAAISLAMFSFQTDASPKNGSGVNLDKLGLSGLRSVVSSLSGTVTDLDGKPLTGIFVNYSRIGVWGGDAETPFVTTDGSGNWVLPEIRHYDTNSLEINFYDGICEGTRFFQNKVLNIDLKDLTKSGQNTYVLDNIRVKMLSATMPVSEKIEIMLSGRLSTSTKNESWKKREFNGIKVKLGNHTTNVNRDGGWTLKGSVKPQCPDTLALEVLGGDNFHDAKYLVNRLKLSQISKNSFKGSDIAIEIAPKKSGKKPEQDLVFSRASESKNISVNTAKTESVEMKKQATGTSHQDFLEAKKHQLAYCAERTLTRNPNLKSPMKLIVKVDKSGKVRSVLLMNKVEDPLLFQCFQKQIMNLEFSSRESEYRIDVTLAFSRSLNGSEKTEFSIQSLVH